jgi:Na+/H+ antiporter NhaA
LPGKAGFVVIPGTLTAGKCRYLDFFFAVSSEIPVLLARLANRNDGVLRTRDDSFLKGHSTLERVMAHVVMPAFSQENAGISLCLCI